MNAPKPPRLTTPDADDIGHNPSGNPSFASILSLRLSRRQTLLGGLSAATTAIFGGSLLSGCSDDKQAAPRLGFNAIAKSLADSVSVPAGYRVDVLYRLGDPIAAGLSSYVNDGSDGDMDRRAGDHHDGMHFFGLNAAGTRDDRSNDRGLLVLNHENISEQYLHPAGPTAAPRPESEARKEMNCHGVSVVEIRRGSDGRLAYVQNSSFNRRITPFTEMRINGPVRGSEFAITAYAPDGSRTRGTLNNCANGYTPWGTYLTCEENWAGYFKRPSSDNALRGEADLRQLTRYGVSSSTGANAWSTVMPDTDDKAFGRFSATVSGSSSDGSDDFRNEANGFGYVVEIDPFSNTSMPRKRTAIGRMGHEGCWPSKVEAGKPLVFYTGDDSRGEYIYKFVSDAVWDPADASGGLDAGDKYLDAGTLYVARFNADGTGSWIALKQGQNGLTASNSLFPFSTQAAVCVATRLAADSVGATRMDRPEWGAVNPSNGEVYMTLTNNSNRGISSNQPLDAANPRSYDAATDGNPDLDGNVNGHIIRWREQGDSPAAVAFTWDVYLFASRASYGAGINLSGLDDSNDLSSPDGLWFGPNDILWIQTDDGAYTDVTNCMLLAAVPGTVGDGGPVTVQSGTVSQQTFMGAAPGAQLRRFLVGPRGCEITGLTATPDGKALFVNIQHPGEGSATSTWPDGGSARPRSATVVITRDDGGVVGS